MGAHPCRHLSPHPAPHHLPGSARGLLGLSRHRTCVSNGTCNNHDHPALKAHLGVRQRADRSGHHQAAGKQSAQRGVSLAGAQRNTCHENQKRQPRAELAECPENRSHGLLTNVSKATPWKPSPSSALAAVWAWFQRLARPSEFQCPGGVRLTLHYEVK